MFLTSVWILLLHFKFTLKVLLYFRFGGVWLFILILVGFGTPRITVDYQYHSTTNSPTWLPSCRPRRVYILFQFWLVLSISTSNRESKYTVVTIGSIIYLIYFFDIGMRTPKASIHIISIQQMIADVDSCISWMPVVYHDMGVLEMYVMAPMTWEFLRCAMVVVHQ